MLHTVYCVMFTDTWRAPDPTANLFSLGLQRTKVAPRKMMVWINDGGSDNTARVVYISVDSENVSARRSCYVLRAYYAFDGTVPTFVDPQRRAFAHAKND